MSKEKLGRNPLDKLKFSDPEPLQIDKWLSSSPEPKKDFKVEVNWDEFLEEAVMPHLKKFTKFFGN